MEADEVEELSKQRGIYDDYLAPIDSIGDYHGLKAAADALGLDTGPFRSLGFDHKAAATRLQSEFKIDPRNFSSTSLRVYSKDASNLKNEDAADYSKSLKESVKQPIAQALNAIVAANDRPYIPQANTQSNAQDVTLIEANEAHTAQPLRASSSKPAASA